ncbi:MAG: Deoxyguanosinetriphosphate triphosphohydrolase-like protein [Candidatus Uhrbacteria bacterium GW2011_GWE2_45_35]|uniref:Deoxyguanosinetriphosphate triphosphohydrolase-like protein n=2 Tax=Candidatus Uhriibacteriota TaxID=1752732 RepID=A0A0G1MBM6_9BACT|nr:MAG: Deoxyguanosinetriphosphate triphosphohydrolase-like protein [Candidatus Uhrbacteria bacterium GW2011_GWF2_44_350]KKU07716.1 MAG: Deoxyguanosinetriphosphate triphosphohydrolase-like protein [Candidatus Uhrbacteria bacterium GW2011_GWE2_45_35]HBR80999.1 hypothetical protein [Candidatus Uhrbacteria bacterium]HCU31402.1 hypothetical protein [Candidatus Uhrbacteria bacterium]
MEYKLSVKITPADVRFLRSELAPIIGCLCRLATPASAAVRRVLRDEDGDGVLIGLPGVDPYWIDAALKLMPSRGLRRAAHHTQVVTEPDNLHIRTRRSHSDEVASIAVMIASILGANPALCLAGALGHDIGHTPLGHFGEMFLTQKTGQNFRHEVFGCVAAQHIERSGNGLNLTKQTLRIMHRHSRGSGPLLVSELSLEEAIVMYADKIAYTFADYNDFCRLLTSDVWIGLSPRDIEAIHVAMRRLGQSQRERVARCIVALCRESAGVGYVSFCQGEAFNFFEAARQAMYKFYPSNNPSRHGFPGNGAVYDSLAEIFPDINTTVLFALLCDDDLEKLKKKVGLIATPALESLLVSKLSVADIIPHLRGRTIDPFDPDLDWEGIPDVSYAT